MNKDKIEEVKNESLLLTDEEIRHLGRPQLHLMPLMKSIADAQRAKCQQSIKESVYKEIEDYKCDECSTPNFVHLVIPLRIWNEWKQCHKPLGNTQDR